MHLTWMVVPEADKLLDESASFVLPWAGTQIGVHERLCECAVVWKPVRVHVSLAPQPERRGPVTALG